MLKCVAFGITKTRPGSILLPSSPLSSILHQYPQKSLLHPTKFVTTRQEAISTFIDKKHTNAIGVTSIHRISSPSALILPCHRMHPSPPNQQIRNLAIRRRKKKRVKDDKPLMNEKLGKILPMKKKTSPSQLKVRMVLDVDKDSRKEVSVVSLSEALEKAKELKLDLIAVNLDADIPVLKCADYARVAYDLKKRVKEREKERDVAPTKVKEFRFKAGIEGNDLERKISDMIKYLKLGHSCQVTIRSAAFRIRRDEDVISTNARMVFDRVKEYLINEPKMKMRGTNSATLLLQPKKQS